MAAVNLNNVQFWQPPLEPNRATKSKDHTLPATNRSSQSNSAMALSRGHQPKDDRISNRGYAQDLTSSEGEAEGDSDDEFPSVKDILYPTSSQQTSVRIQPQGTRDKPITLDDDDDRLDLDSDTASNSGSASLEIRADAVLKSNKTADPASYEAWREIDNNQRPLFLLERDDLALTGPRTHTLSLAGLSYPNSQGRSEDPTPCLRPTGVGADDGRNELGLLDSSGVGGSMDSPSAFGSEVLQAFEEQDRFLSPPPGPRRRSPERLQNQNDGYFQAESNSTRTKGLEDASQVEAPREGGREDLVRQPEAGGELEEQQYAVEEGVLGAMEKMDMPREEQQGDDLDDVQSKPAHQCLPTSVVNEQLSTLPYQSPSAVAKSGTAAEYHEWPLHGFFKRIRIGSDTAFNLEFHLVNISEQLDLSGPFRALGSSVGNGLSDSAHSKTHQITSRPQKSGPQEVLHSLSFSPGCPADFEEPQPAALVIDPDHQWEIRKIIGQKMIGRERHFRVQWKETWMPESELLGAKELVDTFMTELGTGTGGRKRPQKRSRLATGLPDAWDEEEPKKRRGRS